MVEEGEVNSSDQIRAERPNVHQCIGYYDCLIDLHHWLQRNVHALDTATIDALRQELDRLTDERRKEAA